MRLNFPERNKRYAVLKPGCNLLPPGPAGFAGGLKNRVYEKILK